MARKKKQRRQFGYVYQEPGRRSWYISFAYGGKRIKRSAGKTKADAEKKLLQIEALIRSGVPLRPIMDTVFDGMDARKLRFRDAVDSYLQAAKHRNKLSTLDRDRTRLRQIERAPWAGKYLGKITKADLASWINTERDRGLAAGTCNRKLAVVSALFEWARGLEYVDANPVRDVARFSEKNSARELFLTAAECEAVISAANDDFRPLLIAAIHTGARAGELTKLAWSDVDLARGFVWFRDTKSGGSRSVPLTATLHACLAELKRCRPRPTLDERDLVFSIRSGGAISAQTRRRRLADAIRQARGLRQVIREGFRFHDLRHSAASVMINAGVPLEAIGAVLGHKRAATTKRYAHLLPETSRAAIDRLGGALGAAKRGAS